MMQGIARPLRAVRSLYTGQLRGVGRGPATGLGATNFAASRRGQATVGGDRGDRGAESGNEGADAEPPSAMDEQVRAVFHNPGGYRLPDDTLDCEAFAITLAGRPGPNPVTGAHFARIPVNLLEASQDGRIPDHMVLAKTLYLSVDPFMRCRFNEDTGVEYTLPYQIGEPITSAGIGVVVECGNAVETLAPGDIVIEPFDSWPWQTDVLLEADKLTCIPQSLSLLIPVSNLLGAVGQTGVSAYFGIKRCGQCSAADVVVISGAAGAVGTAVGQLAKQSGATVIGICGTDAKVEQLKRLGFDAAVNYKTTTNLQADLERTLDDLGCWGTSIYFDNVGGDVSERVIPTMSQDGRIVICGQISMYDTAEAYPPPVSDIAQAYMERKAISRDRFLVLDYASDFGEALSELCFLRASNKLVAPETITSGLEHAPAAFVSMMAGGNVGKAVVRCGDRPLPLAVIDGIRALLPPPLRGVMSKSFATPSSFKPDLDE